LTILDAYAVIAYLRGEPAADRVRELLSQGEAAALTAVGLAEVVDHLVRLAGADEEDVLLDLGQLGLLEAVPVDPALGAAAGRLRAGHYHRARCSISMADCLAAEAARAAAQPLATSDPHLLAVCNLEEIDAIPLADTTGNTWIPPN
jgi:PIN domain nuclease of toxin-antitoxin system